MSQPMKTRPYLIPYYVIPIIVEDPALSISNKASNAVSLDAHEMWHHTQLHAW